MSNRHPSSSLPWLRASLYWLVLLHGSAWAQHRDIFLASRADGQLAVIGEVSIFSGAFGAPYLDDPGLVHHWTKNPGFASLNSSFLPDGYSPLPPESELSFSLHSFSLNGLANANAWYWDGVDQGGDGDYLADIDFSPLDSGAWFQMFFGAVHMQFLSSGVVGGDDSDQPGYLLAETTQGGGLHIHPGYGVSGPAATPPDQGVYLVSLRLQMENLLESEPLYFVFRTEEVSSTAGDAARIWLNNAALGDEQLPGDFNSDGVVDAADYTSWRDGVGVDFANGDYEVWRSHYGGASSAVETGSDRPLSVPEPHCIAMLLSMLLLKPMRSARTG